MCESHRPGVDRETYFPAVFSEGLRTDSLDGVGCSCSLLAQTSACAKQVAASESVSSS